MTDHLNSRAPRMRKFSDAEFASLPRNGDGDIVDLYDAYSFITSAQRSKLTGDDWSRMLDLDEEVQCLLADARAEFGLC